MGAWKGGKPHDKVTRLDIPHVHIQSQTLDLLAYDGDLYQAPFFGSGEHNRLSCKEDKMILRSIPARVSPIISYLLTLDSTLI